MSPGAAQRPGSILGPHTIDGLIAGSLTPGVVELKLAGLGCEAAEGETEQAQPTAALRAGRKAAPRRSRR